jgi:hypothetical protein
MYQKIVTCLLAFCMVLTVILPDTSAGAAAKSTTTTVSTQKALDAALKNDSVTDIVFETQKEVTITIAASSGAKNKKLTISAANATVTNSAVFKSIKIKNASKYTEKATGNSITVTDSDAQLVIAKKASVKSISSSAAKLKLTAKENATVKNLTNKKEGAKITVSAAKGASVKVTLKKNATVKKSGKGTVDVKEPSNSSSTAETKTYSAHGLTTTLGNASINYHGGKLQFINLSLEIPSPADSSSQLTYDKTTFGGSSDQAKYIKYKCSSLSGLQNTEDFRDSYVAALSGAGFELAYEYEDTVNSYSTDTYGICYFNYTGTETLDTPVEGKDGNYYPLAFWYRQGYGEMNVSCASQIGTPELFAETDTRVESNVSTSDNMLYMGIFRDSADYHVVGLLNFNDRPTRDNISMMIPTDVSVGDVLTKDQVKNLLLVDHNMEFSSYSTPSFGYITTRSIVDFNLEIIAYDDSVLVYYLSYCAYTTKDSDNSTRYFTEALVAIDISSAKVTTEDELNNDSDSSSDSSDSTTITPGITTGSTCAVCKGTGKTTCNTCHGHIKINCTSCNGSGTIRRYGQTSSCSACGGVGWTKCKRCTNGSVQCTACGGKGRIG